ncbi:MAG: iron ABC transporter permease [Bacteroidota bacterium]|jgi:iron complex transport system permease protein|nr:iron ABC transporter permease [Bacteroidales bacterium]MDI9535643.1 iron ABC transporter permease [Bacteroidota bacterium]OQC46440.1 MAG: Hemin transport system permease protein HmuU [Bacteroidetes bacterium ADurb.Bin028]NLP20635.1 iron ABC transporter permease [Bacteroidales bacterium]HNY43504.1 iron ABC transporter permease [Bacteroidales bacterium]
MKKTKLTIKFILLSVFLIFLGLLDLLSGSIQISVSDIFNYIFSSNTESEFYLLLKEFRFPRMSMAILAGASLSISGLIMQTLFRNPLAGPDILGISSGASLGVAIVVLGGSYLFGNHFYHASNYITLIAAGIGAASILGLILIISYKLRDILSILIIGILLAGIISAIVNILQYFATGINVKSFVVWTMGSLTASSSKDLLLASPIILIFVLLAFSLSKNLNLMLLGENFAKTMGVNIKLLRILSFTIVSILTGVITVYCGPIGFVGIAVPHISRWIFNTSNHFVLIPASALLGGIFMLCGDILSNLFTSNGNLPINAITAILAAPFIIWVVFKNKRTFV